jgi:hypothetical protein
MRDFTNKIYLNLLDSFLQAGYAFQTFHQYLQAPQSKTILLRHDVDARKSHSLRFARIQREKGIAGTYYFRVVPKVYDEDMIREIYEMGHEIGYHYEDMDFAKGDPHVAIRFFEQHLEQIRKVAPVHTICMHGSPRSRYDNKDVWKFYDYHAYGIAGEPYFDLDFKRVFYLTDTGRRWDGDAVSVRDKVKSRFQLRFHHTREIIERVRKGHFPETAMLNFHPQRWTDDPNLWLLEKYQQKAKNIVKYYIIKSKKPN